MRLCRRPSGRQRYVGVPQSYLRGRGDGKSLQIGRLRRAVFHRIPLRCLRGKHGICGFFPCDRNYQVPKPGGEPLPARATVSNPPVASGRNEQVFAIPDRVKVEGRAGRGSPKLPPPPPPKPQRRGSLEPPPPAIPASPVSDSGQPARRPSAARRQRQRCQGQGGSRKVHSEGPNFFGPIL
jgi:hypothetical protein